MNTIERLARSLGDVAETLKVRYMGLGFVLAWIYCLWFSGSVLSEVARSSFTSLLLSMGGSAVALLAVALRRAGEAPSRDVWVVVSPVAMAATTAVLAVDVPQPLSLAAALVGGIASAPLWLHWGRLFCLMEQEALERNVCALALVTVATATVVCNLPHVLASVVVSALPVVSGIMLLASRGTLFREVPASGGVAGLGAPEGAASGDAARAPIMQLAPIALCSAVFSTASSLVICTAGPAHSLIWGAGALSAIIGGGLVAVVLFFATIAFADRVDFSFLSRWLVPVMVVSLACVSVGVPVVGAAGVTLAGSVAFMTDCLFIIVFVRLCRHGVCGHEVAFGLFRGCVQLGACAGTALGATLVDRGIPLVPVYQAMVCLCAFVPMVVTALEKRLVAVGHAGTLNDGAAAGDGPAGETGCACEPDRGNGALAALGDRCRLSPREQEILALLVRGRSVPYMRETLAISTNTIETHVKHIYAKVGVHSKQELLDLVEREEKAAGGDALQ